MDQTWFKVRIMLPYENDLISKLRETLMDTLEHNAAAGHPSIFVMRGNNLTTLSDGILQRLGKASRHVMPTCDSAAFSVPSHVTLMMDRGKTFDAELLSGYLSGSIDVSGLFSLKL